MGGEIVYNDTRFYLPRTATKTDNYFEKITTHQHASFNQAWHVMILNTVERTNILSCWPVMWRRLTNQISKFYLRYNTFHCNPRLALFLSWLYFDTSKHCSYYYCLLKSSPYWYSGLLQKFHGLWYSEHTRRSSVSFYKFGLFICTKNISLISNSHGEFVH